MTTETKTKENSKAVEISSNVQKTAEAMKEDITIGDDNIAVLKNPEEYFKIMLPDNVSEEKAKATLKTIGEFSAAVVKALGEKTLDHVKNNKDVSTVTMNTNFCGKNSISVKIDKEKDYPNPSSTGDNDKQIHKYGVVGVKVNLEDVKSKKGEISKVSHHLENLYSEVLGK